ncbi:MAG: hypothetical protein K0R34_1205 [Herbinix sp.]|jgi:hypothetical protein|nr:hypothetical protein [Herbinix sp.]
MYRYHRINILYGKGKEGYKSEETEFNYNKYTYVK